MMRKISLFLLTLSASATALAESKINMPQGVTEVSRDIYSLHMLIFLVCCAIAVFVFGWMIIALVLHRKSRGVEPAKFSHSTKAEIIWTIIPIGILIGMAIPSAETLVKIEDSRNPDITVKVTGYQWKWHYEYLDEGVEFYSNLARSSNEARRLGSGIDVNTVPNYLLEVDNPMVVPVGAKVRLLITSNDVIHAWWMKDFGIKKDAIPGFINEAWFRAEEPGVYRGQCAELCGKDHGFMPIVVEVLDQAEYEGWVAARQEEQGVTPKLAAAAAE
ncbi:cytochrome c oxidase subunit II [Lentisalinibacter salinarum]|uniref:cytochrome c oxidase subunit II n=1 Tax=Lentisalinibacter salinarum TaxID=2992239 RepID=UPI003865E6B0